MHPQNQWVPKAAVCSLPLLVCVRVCVCVCVCVVRECIHRAGECPCCSVLPALASACMCVIRKFIRRASECPDCSVLLAVASVCMCVVSSSTEPVGVLAVMWSFLFVVCACQTSKAWEFVIRVNSCCCVIMSVVVCVCVCLSWRRGQFCYLMSPWYPHCLGRECVCVANRSLLLVSAPTVCSLSWWRGTDKK